LRKANGIKQKVYKYVVHFVAMLRKAFSF